MHLPFARTVYRLRPRPILDPYSQEQTGEDWNEPIEFPIPGASVQQTSTARLGDATREQALESKSLFCDGKYDIRKGDRIRNGPPGAPIYGIAGVPPEADTNPFTGWTPPREIPLTRGVG